MTEPTDRAAVLTLTRTQLATLLAHHSDVLAASLHADARSGLPEHRAGVERATELLTLHANAMTANEETPAVAEILDSAFEFPEWVRRLAAEAPTSPEEIARAHVLALHQIGEQLAGIESWMWEHLANVRGTAHTQERPRCPHCQMPHDLTPGSLPVAVCTSVLQRIADGERLHSEGDHSLCARVACEVLREQPAARVRQDETCSNCRGSGLDPRHNGEFVCPDCAPAAGVRQDGAQLS